MNEKQKNNVNEKNNKNVKAKENVNVQKKTKKKKKNSVVSDGNTQNNKPSKNVNKKKKKAKNKAQKQQQNTAQTSVKQPKSKKKNKKKKQKKIKVEEVKAPVIATKKQEHIDISACKRNGFKGCYYESGFGSFKGQIDKIKSRHICFKRIWIQWEYGLDVCEDKEDHVWIFDAEPIFKIGVKEGDCVSFVGEIHPYKRRNGTCELGIRGPECVEKINEYDLPTDEDIFLQNMHKIECELCLFRDHCDGLFCLKANR